MLHHQSAAEEILSIWTFTEILNLLCDLDLDHNRAIQSFHKTIHLMMMYHQIKLSCKRISCSDNISKRHILITLSITVTLTLNTTIKLLPKTFWFMTMYYQTKFDSKRISSSKDTVDIVIFWSDELSCIMMSRNTKFGNKMLGGIEDIIWTNINILTLRCDTDMWLSNFFHRTLWLLAMYQQTKFGSQRINSSENIVERVIFW